MNNAVGNFGKRIFFRKFCPLTLTINLLHLSGVCSMVSSNISSIQTLDDLQCFVYQTICNDHELLPDAFPTSENVLRKSNGISCGMMFCLHGPRKTKFTAIWEKEKNRILFYGPSGNRYQQVVLDESPVATLEIN